jgi:hypothetical protein
MNTNRGFENGRELRECSLMNSIRGNQRKLRRAFVFIRVHSWLNRMSEISKAYEPQAVESKWYQFWLDHQCFVVELSGNRAANALKDFHECPQKEKLAGKTGGQQRLSRSFPD